MPLFTFSVDGFTANTLRSRNSDTDYVVCNLKVGNQDFGTRTVSVGDVSSGQSVTTDCKFRDIPLDNPQDEVIFTFAVLNSGHATGEEINKILDAAIDKSAGIIGALGTSAWDEFVNACAGLVKGAADLINPNCDGWVAGDSIKVTVQTLMQQAPQGYLLREQEFPGYNSPAGCGGNSDYTVRWSLAKQFTGTWSGWASLGGQLTAAPAVSSWGGNRLDVFGRGTDGALWHLAFDGTNWNTWQSLGGQIVDNPAAVSWGQNRIDVLARGTDDALWHISWDGNLWSGWTTIGEIATSGPAAGSQGAGLIDVLFRGKDAGLYHVGYFDGAWHSVEGLGGVITGAPTVVCPQFGTVDAYVMGTDGALVQKAWFNSEWTDWTTIDTVPMSTAPSVSSLNAGRRDVFAVLGDGSVSQKTWTSIDGWQSWVSIGGKAVSGPGVVCSASGRLDVFVVGTDGALWHNSLTVS